MVILCSFLRQKYSACGCDPKRRTRRSWREPNRVSQRISKLRNFHRHRRRAAGKRLPLRPTQTFSVLKSGPIFNKMCCTSDTCFGGHDCRNTTSPLTHKISGIVAWKLTRLSTFQSRSVASWHNSGRSTRSNLRNAATDRNTVISEHSGSCAQFQPVPSAILPYARPLAAVKFPRQWLPEAYELSALLFYCAILE